MRTRTETGGDGRESLLRLSATRGARPPNSTSVFTTGRDHSIGHGERNDGGEKEMNGPKSV